MTNMYQSSKGPIAIEVWRPAPNLEGRYEVSDRGRVRHVSGRYPKLKTRHGGYRFLSVSNGRGGSANISVAHLVCGAFNGARPAGLDVDHINRERGDDRPSNLRWVTRSENLKNREVCRGSGHANSKLNELTVRAIRAGDIPGNNRQIAELLGVSRETVRDVRLGKVWGHVK